MSKLVEFEGKLVHLSEIDPARARFEDGDMVYAVWPFYRPGISFIYKDGRFYNPRGVYAPEDNYFYDNPDHFRRFWGALPAQDA